MSAKPEALTMPMNIARKKSIVFILEWSYKNAVSAALLPGRM